jgi:hypothetical protein
MATKITKLALIVSAAALAACSGSPKGAVGSAPPTTAASAAAATTSAPQAPLPAVGVELPGTKIPWNQVGPGWMLATWSTAPSLRPGETPPDGQPPVAPLTLYLLDPAGGRYAITTFPVVGASDNNLGDPGQVPDLVDWSGNGRHAMLEDRETCPMSFVEQKWRCNDPNAPEQYTTITDVDLATGAKQSFTVDDWAHGAYSRPTGQAVLVSSQYGSAPAPLKRVDLSGKEQLTFAKDLGSDYLAFPDGTQLVFGAANGLAIVGNDGAAGRKLPIPGAVTRCAPVRWWTQTVILARCDVSLPSGSQSGTQLWQVPLDGGGPTALTAVNSGKEDDPGFGADLGDGNAWQLPSGTYLQSAGACGTMFLSRLTPDGHTTRVPVPGAEGSVGVVGATADKLVLQARMGCGEGTSLLTFDPAANTASVVLGPPVNGGSTRHAVLYPTG